MSHAVAMLSAMFPPGEDFFVRSVRACRDEITHADLREQVKGFIGQEAMHGRGHREFNDRLAAIGYPTKGLEKVVDRSLRIHECMQGRRANLAVTAALEHSTATFASGVRRALGPLVPRLRANAEPGLETTERETGDRWTWWTRTARCPGAARRLRFGR